MLDRHPQDDWIIIEALVEFSHDQREIRPERAARAWVLAKQLAEQHGLTIEEALQHRAPI